MMKALHNEVSLHGFKALALGYLSLNAAGLVVYISQIPGPQTSISTNYPKSQHLQGN